MDATNNVIHLSNNISSTSDYQWNKYTKFNAMALAQGLPLSSPACGQVVHGNVTLTANLVCLRNGLIVGGDNTTINLNGYSVNGPGDNSSKVGIAIPHSNSVLIQNFWRYSGFPSRDFDNWFLKTLISTEMLPI